MLSQRSPTFDPKPKFLFHIHKVSIARNSILFLAFSAKVLAINFGSHRDTIKSIVRGDLGITRKSLDHKKGAVPQRIKIQF